MSFFKFSETLYNSVQRKWFYFVLIIIFLFYPYVFVDAIIPQLPNSSPYFYLSIGILIFSINLTSKRNPLPRSFWFVIIVMVCGCLLSYFVTGGKYYYHIILVVFCSVNLIILVHNKIGLTSFFFIYNRWILLMAILGTITFFLALIGIGPFYEFDSLNDGRPMSTWFISCAKGFELTRFVRYAGFFDEPGAMGYWGMFALSINRLFIKDMKIEIPLIILLSFTFSLGFITQVLFYIAFFYLLKGRSSIKICMSMLLVLVISVIYSTKDTEYDMIYESTIGRFESMEKGQEFMEGTTREFNTKLSKEEWEKSPIWGNGRKSDSETTFLGDNVYETLAYDGIVGTFYFYFPYLLLFCWGIKNRDTELIGICIFCALAAFHRPIHANLLTFFVLYSIPAMYGLKLQNYTLDKTL